MRIDLSGIDDRARLAVGLAAVIEPEVSSGPVVDALHAIAVALADGADHVSLDLTAAYAEKMPILFRRARRMRRYGPPAAPLDQLEAAIEAARTDEDARCRTR